VRRKSDFAFFSFNQPTVEIMKYKGHIAWKCAYEYNPSQNLWGGEPYYIITTDDHQMYFYEYDTAAKQYVLVMEADDSHFEEWYEMGLTKQKALRSELLRRGEIFTIE